MSDLIIQTENGVRILKLNRPERLNAMNDVLSAGIPEALNAASADDEVRVVVITGEGRGFSAGLDLSNPAALMSSFDTRHKRLDEMAWVGRQAQSIVQCDKPVIAAINGIAAGAGLALALACDLRYMAASARLTTGYVRRGLSPDAGMTYFLPRLIGQTRANEWILTGRDMLADEADRIGLVNGVFADEEFFASVMEVATSLAAGPPIALTYSKRLLTDTYDTDLTTQLRRELHYIKACFQTQDVMEGIGAFAQKRPPNFSGK